VSITFVAETDLYESPPVQHLPAGAQAGDLLIATIYQGSGPSSSPGARLVDSSFSTLVAIGDSSSSGFGTLVIQYKIAGASEPSTYDYTGEGGLFYNRSMVAYRPSVAGAIRIADHSVQTYPGSGAKSANLVAPSLVAGAGDTELEGFFCACTTSGAVTSSPATTRVQNINAFNSAQTIAEQSGLSAGATGTQTMVLNSADWGVAVSILLTENMPKGIPSRLVVPSLAVMQRASAW
jgi:hypothetical protein